MPASPTTHGGQTALLAAAKTIPKKIGWRYVLLALGAMANEHGRIEVSVTDLGEAVGIHRADAHKAIIGLIDLGHVRQLAEGTRRGSAAVYELVAWPRQGVGQAPTPPVGQPPTPHEGYTRAPHARTVPYGNSEGVDRTNFVCSDPADHVKEEQPSFDGMPKGKPPKAKRPMAPDEISAAIAAREIRKAREASGLITASDLNLKRLYMKFLAAGVEAERLKAAMVGAWACTQASIERELNVGSPSVRPAESRAAGPRYSSKGLDPNRYDEPL